MTRDGKRLPNILIGIFLALVAIAQLIPFYVTFTTALKPRDDRSSTWIPPLNGIAWENFDVAITRGGILTAIGNSALITVVSTVIVCVVAAAAAYPLARRNTWGNKIVMSTILGLMMIPPLSILVPLYSLLRQMGAINTYPGAIAVMVVTQLPLAIFLYTSFMRSLPISVEEAARVDGASQLQTLWRVVVPMLKPVTATVVILTSVNVWNEYALSVFVLTDASMRTIAPSISTFFASQGSNLGAAAAGSLLAVVPVLIAYLLLQKQFIAGMTAGAEK